MLIELFCLVNEMSHQNCKLVTHFFAKISYNLENVAINDVLPLKAARRDAIANLKYIQYAAPPYSARISAVYSSRFATFGWVRFPRATRGKHNAKFTKGR